MRRGGIQLNNQNFSWSFSVTNLSSKYRALRTRCSLATRSWRRAKIEGPLYALRYFAPFVFCTCSPASQLDAAPSVGIWWKLVISHQHSNFDIDSSCRPLIGILRRPLICSPPSCTFLAFAHVHVHVSGVLPLMVIYVLWKAISAAIYAPNWASKTSTVRQCEYSWWGPLKCF